MTRRYWVGCDVLVNAPIALVFDYLTDWPRQGEWMLGTKVELLDRPTADRSIRSKSPLNENPVALASRVGERFRAFTGIGKIGFWDNMTVTRWQPPYQVDVAHTGRFVRGTGFMHLTEVSDTCTRFEWSEELEIPLGFLGRIGWPLVRPFFLAGVRHSLKRFAKCASSHVD